MLLHHPRHPTEHPISITKQCSISTILRPVLAIQFIYTLALMVSHVLKQMDCDQEEADTNHLGHPQETIVKYKYTLTHTSSSLSGCQLLSRPANIVVLSID